MPLLLWIMLNKFTESKRVKNITAAIETLIPDQKETSQYDFEDIQVPELSFEFSTSSALSVDYYVLALSQLAHGLLWYIYWNI